MASRTRSILSATAVLPALLVVLAAALTLPTAPLRVGGAVLGELVHLAAALAAGATLLRLPRAKPRDALELLVVATALGLALLSLLSLLGAALGLVGRALPWLVDLAALLIGAGSIRPVLARLRDAWDRLDLSFVMASRIPLLALLAVVSLIHAAPPFLPPTNATGAGQLALVSQAEVRKDLREALAARTESTASPSAGLLLHGQLSSGHWGARLHLSALALLLAAAVFLHARRHLGGHAAGWAGLCLASSPALLWLEAADPSGLFLALFAWLAYVEIADWCRTPRRGKMALGSIFGGLLAAESAAGLSLFVLLLVFVFLVQGLIDRHGILRQLPGLAGMACIAVMAAAPFVLSSSWLERETPVQQVLSRYGPEAAPLPVGALWARPSAGLAEPGAQPRVVAESLLSLGPLVLGLLFLVPLVPDPPEGLRHGVLLLALAGIAWFLPPPWATGVFVLPVAALCSGAAARALLALGGLSGRLAALLVLFAGPVTLLAALHAGPDLFAGGSVVAGTLSRRESLERFVPDHGLVAAVRLRLNPRHDQVLLAGELTDCHYPVPALRWPEALDLQEPLELARALRAAEVSHVALDRRSPGVPAPGALAACELVLETGTAGRYALYAVPRLESLGENEVEALDENEPEALDENEPETRDESELDPAGPGEAEPPA